MPDYKVSIIIPTFNEKEHLPSCLESISDLNYPEKDIEVIVVDNGSTDNTREIAESYGATLLMDSTQNVSGLRNLGVEKSTGEIIAFVDADCVVSKEWLSKAAIYFEDRGVAAWGGPPSIPKESTWVQKTWFLVRGKEDQVQDVDWLETMNLFVRREQFLSIDGLNKSLETCEDVDFSYRIRECGRIVSDSRIEVIHLGEAATVREFLRKEIWRGRSNFNGVFSHGLVLKEIPSLGIPLYFGILMPFSFFAFIILLNPKWLFVYFLLYLLPSFAVILKKKMKGIGVCDILRLLMLLQVYFFSRTIAVLKKK